MCICSFLQNHDQTGHWILNVFPQCDGDLKNLHKAEFTVSDHPAIDPNISSDSLMGCVPCTSKD
jgi:hypothetical protein